MRNYAKALSIVLVLVLFTAIAAASSSRSKETQAIKTNADTTTDVNSDDNNDGDATAAPQTTAAPAAVDVTIAEQVLLDHEGVIITATEYTTDSIWGDGMKLLIENNSDEDVGIGCTALIVNNYMINDLFVSSIAAGKKANETIYFSSSELKAAGIETIGQVEVYFHLYNPDDYMTFYDADVATIRTSAFADMDTAPNDAGEELFNQDGIRIVGKYTDENSFWGTSMLLYIENTSGTNVGVACDNMSINGFMVSPLFSSTVFDGKMAISAITIFSSDLEDNDITTVEDVELVFRIYNADTYSTIVESDPITFTVK